MLNLFPHQQLAENSVVDIWGLKCVIETPQFTLRAGKDFVSPSPAHYGYIKGYKGADGDEIDCYIGTKPGSQLAFVIDQNKLHSLSVFDEHKIMLAYVSKNEAIRDYFFGHNAARRIIRAITTVTIQELKRWLKEGDLKRPISEFDFGRRPYTPTDWWKYYGPKIWWKHTGRNAWQKRKHSGKYRSDTGRKFWSSDLSRS